MTTISPSYSARKRFASAGLALCIAAGSLTACQQYPGGPGMRKEEFGALTGAAAGAAVGSNVGGGKGRVAAIALGTLLGAAMGGDIGRSLDRADMMYYHRKSQMALETTPSGQALPWRNPETGTSGVIKPLNVYQADNGKYCREYTQTITVGGRTQEGYGRACRQQDGSWQLAE